MTPEELKRLVRSRTDPLTFADAFSDLDERARKALSKAAQEIYREARKAEQANWGQPGHEGSLARLAMLACCPWSQSKRVQGARWRLFVGNSRRWARAIIKILSDRRPDWAERWIELQLDRTRFAWENVLSWEDVGELIKAGVISRPACDGYVRLMAGAEVDPETAIDEDVLEHDVWRLFEVDTDAFDGVPDPKKIDRERWRRRELADEDTPVHERYYGWPWRLYVLAHQGRIDRDRLIDAILNAFWRDFRTPAQGGLLRFLAILDPTADETAARQATYMELLRNDYGPVVGMALRSLETLHRANRLDARGFLEAVPPVFGAVTKTHAQKALSLIDKVTKNAGGHLPGAITAVAAALNHRSPEIQEQAIAILARWKKADAAIDLAAILESAAMLAPQHRRALAALTAEPASPVETITEADRHSDSRDSDQLRSRTAALLNRVAALPEWLVEVCGLSRLEGKLNQGSLPDVFDPAPTACPVLSGVEPIEPIRDVDELIDIAFQVLSGDPQPEDEERLVDGILRLGASTTVNLRKKTIGLRKLVNEHFQGMGWVDKQIVDAPEFLVTHALLLLIGRWLGMRSLVSASETSYLNRIADALSRQLHGLVDDHGTAAVLRDAIRTKLGRLSPLAWRLAELYDRLDCGQYGPVVSTPTNAHGWIDPRVFVERVSQLQQRGITVGKLDFIGGLLRLAPDFRAAALQTAETLQEPHGRIARYALGGAERPEKSDSPYADEWLAAGRARSPRGHLSELAVLGLSPEEPDGITPATYHVDCRVDPRELRNAHWTGQRSLRAVHVTPDKPEKGTRHFRPTVALAARVLDGDVVPLWDTGPRANPGVITPLNTDSTLAIAVHVFFVSLDERTTVFADPTRLLAPLFQVDRGWSDIARTALCLALVSRDDQLRGTAIDALIEGIADGRADVQRISDSLIEVSTGGWIKLNRLASSLGEVARTSVTAERVVAGILDRVIASWDRLPRDAHHLLSLQLELLTNLQHALSSEARRVLSNVPGSGKTAKLAKHLCQMTSEQPSLTMLEAAIEAAEGRLARAERIARHLNSAT